MDIDGTAVPNAINAVPSEKVVTAIKEAQIKVHVSVCTSRPVFMAKEVIRALGIVDPCGINDGTQIYDPKFERIIEEFPLSSIAAASARKKLIQSGYKFMWNDGVNEDWDTGGNIPKVLCGYGVPDITSKEADQLMGTFSSIPKISVHKALSYKKGLVWLVITSPVATKLHSVIALCKLLHVKPEETIGIGDGYNDYALLSACGLKIAMGNAVPELKAIADFIAPSVDEDGVATIIEKFILT